MRYDGESKFCKQSICACTILNNYLIFQSNSTTSIKRKEKFRNLKYINVNVILIL